VVVKLEGDKAEAMTNEAVKALAFNLALHVAAFNPLYLDRTKVDADYLKEQEEIFRVQMSQDEAMQKKPENVRENILKGKVDKLLKDICFVDQKYVKDESMTVAQALASIGKEAGAALKISDYYYYRVGE
jgi:elongation factor Ts